MLFDNAASYTTITIFRQLHKLRLASYGRVSLLYEAWHSCTVHRAIAMHCFNMASYQSSNQSSCIFRDTAVCDRISYTYPSERPSDRRMSTWIDAAAVAVRYVNSQHAPSMSCQSKQCGWHLNEFNISKAADRPMANSSAATHISCMQHSCTCYNHDVTPAVSTTSHQTDSFLHFYLSVTPPPHKRLQEPTQVSPW